MYKYERFLFTVFKADLDLNHMQMRTQDTMANRLPIILCALRLNSIIGIIIPYNIHFVFTVYRQFTIV